MRTTNPVTGVTSEHHLDAPPRTKSDSQSHLYTLVIKPASDEYDVLIDGKSEKKGSLLTDFTPPFIPPTEIDDPEDKKPADWVDDAKIADPAASKPDDWDESAPLMIDDEDATKPAGWLDDGAAFIADPAAVKPSDWSDEDDGEWLAPQIPNPACDAAGCGEWKRPQKRNPAYKGKWVAPLIDNPAYVGVWEPRKIPNPAYFTDAHVGRFGGTAAGSLGIEIWTMSPNVAFDNFVVSRSVSDATASAGFSAKASAQASAAAKAADGDSVSKDGGLISRAVFALNELTGLALSETNALAAVVTAFVALLTFAMYCCGGGGGGGAEKKRNGERPAKVNSLGAEESDNETEGTQDKSAAAAAAVAEEDEDDGAAAAAPRASLPVSGSETAGGTGLKATPAETSTPTALNTGVAEMAAPVAEADADENNIIAEETPESASPKKKGGKKPKKTDE